MSASNRAWAFISWTRCFQTSKPCCFMRVHAQVFGYFRALSKRFPYAIYYKVNGEDIEIWRVLDCRQNPGRTAEALRG